MRHFFIAIISFYKRFISPILGGACRFTPTCSVYSKQAFQKYGAFKGFLLSAKRITSCHPLGGSGFDPVP